MTSVLSSTSDLVTSAARAVARTLLEADDVLASVSRAVTAFERPASALVLTLEGGRPGSLTVVVLDEALPPGVIPAEAVLMAADAAADALGSRVAGSPQSLDPALAVHAVLADPAATIIKLERGTATVGIVAARLTEAGSATPVGTGHNSLRDVDPRRLHLLRGVEMAVSVEIGRTRLTVAELLGLTPGAIVELDRPAGAPADLLVNGRLIGRGEVVVVDESFALRITDIVSADEER